MRITTLLLGIILLANSACQKKVPEGFVERKIGFKAYEYYPNLKGEIRINTPIKFDTILNWVDRSDAGGTIKTRLINSQSCLVQESGFVHNDVCDDDFNRLTIETFQLGPSRDVERDTTGFAYGIMQLERAARAQIDTFVWNSKSIETINRRQFTVLEYFGARLLGFNKSGQAVRGPFERLIASTLVNQGGAQWGISLVFECKKCDYSDFTKSAHTTLQSVVIDTAVVNR